VKRLDQAIENRRALKARQNLRRASSTRAFNLILAIQGFYPWLPSLRGSAARFDFRLWTLVIGMLGLKSQTEVSTPIETSIMVPDVNKPDERPLTILVVDDFDDTRLLLRTWLQRKGFRVVEAEDGNRAIAAAESIHPDLIIMDVEMPELDGLAATRKIRALANLGAVPILAVSAYGADQYRERALEAGCNEYVSTPFEPEELERLIRSLIK